MWWRPALRSQSICNAASLLSLGLNAAIVPVAVFLGPGVGFMFAAVGGLVAVFLGLIGLVGKDSWPIAAVGLGLGATITTSSILAYWYLLEFARNFGH